MFEKKEAGYRLREKRKIKSKATRPIGHVAFIYQSPILRDFEFLQFGIADYAVVPAARGVIFCEHIIQFTNMAH